MAGNETLAALRQWFLEDSAITNLVGQRIYQPKLPPETAWPAIIITELGSSPRINLNGWREDDVQVRVYGNQEGFDLPDHSQLVRTVADVVAKRLARAGGIATAQARLMAVTGVQIIPDEDPDTHQPVQRVLATVQVAELLEAVTP